MMRQRQTSLSVVIAVLALSILVSYTTIFPWVDAAAATPVTKKPVIIDTDANTDDSQALLWLLKRPDVDIKAITVTGTGWCSLSSGLTNVFNLLAFMGRQDIPVTWGSPYALYEIANNDYDCLYSRSVPDAPGGRQWADTLVGLAHCFPKASGYYNPDAPDAPTLIAQILNASSTPIDILELGPATTIATLLSTYPSVKSKIGRVVFSGGSLYAGGNLFFPQPIPNSYAEYNAYGDPEALSQVIQSGVKVTLVPLDATGQLTVTQSFLNSVRPTLATSEAHWIYSLLTTLQIQMGAVFDTYSLWDPYVASVLADEARYTLNVTTIPITVITQAINPAQAGRTLPDPNGTPVSVVLQPNPVIFNDLFLYYNAQSAKSPYPVCVQLNGIWN